jgi:hypothetical protein
LYDEFDEDESDYAELEGKPDEYEPEDTVLPDDDDNLYDEFDEYEAEFEEEQDDETSYTEEAEWYIASLAAVVLSHAVPEIEAEKSNDYQSVWWLGLLAFPASGITVIVAYKVKRGVQKGGKNQP